ncbi:MAG: alpha/beta hydrolase, partial [Lachnospiraceae bacterium]|nr:alpha/beta hydrolase [Lachnospiraceae bacterium]
MIAKIAVLFPGIGYTKNHPLLYYSGKLAQQYDYKVKALEFSGFPHKLKGNREAMMTAFQTAVGQAEEQLRFIDFSAYSEVVFISKSIGTVAASIYAAKYKVPARQLYFTPLEQTFSLIEDGNGL